MSCHWTLRVNAPSGDLAESPSRPRAGQNAGSGGDGVVVIHDDQPPSQPPDGLGDGVGSVELAQVLTHTMTNAEAGSPG